VTDQELIQLAQGLIRIPSVSGEELEAAEYLARQLTPIFDSVRVDAAANVIAELEGREPGPTILLNGHIDVVDAGEMGDAWSGKLTDGAPWGRPGPVIYGRGASDMKGPIAALVAAVSKVKQESFAGRIIFTAVVQEEMGEGVGTRDATASLDQKPDIAISAEPTDFSIGLGHRGKVEFELETRGRTAHSSIPGTGVNALLLMNTFLNAWPELPMPEHPLAGRCTSAITNVTVSPGRLAVIPDRCRLYFDVRFLPGESAARPETDVRTLLERLKESVPHFEYDLRVRMVMPSYLMPPDHPAVELVAAVVRSVTGRTPVRHCYQAGTDGTFLWNEFKIPVLGCGPGDMRLAHTPIEHISVQDLMQARDIYATLIQQIGRAGREVLQVPMV
jgi:putative selenium metabolism hydrolase